jgi:hypothetical protein
MTDEEAREREWWGNMARGLKWLAAICVAYAVAGLGALAVAVRFAKWVWSW